MTNGDRIRQMTDEDLADKLGSYICDNRDFCPIENDRRVTCAECKAMWLKQEVSEDAGTD